MVSAVASTDLGIEYNSFSAASWPVNVVLVGSGLPSSLSLQEE